MVYWQGGGYMVLRSKPASVSNCSEGIDVNPVGFFVFLIFCPTRESKYATILPIYELWENHLYTH